MKTIANLITLGGLLAALGMAQSRHYKITDLGTLPGGNFSQATFIDNKGVITGLASLADGTQHAVIWRDGKILDIAKPGLGGLNSAAFASNEKGQILVQAEASSKDPKNENFCAYGTGLACLPALWENGTTTPLATLGGNNGTVGTMNSRGEAAGIAETAIVDRACPAGVAVNGTGPQVLGFQAVIWGPKLGDIRVLKPLPGDIVGMAIAVNDSGQAVGASGSCANTLLPPIAVGPHAVLWDKDGTPKDLGNLGGTVDVTQLAIGHMALSINNQGDVVGASAVTGNEAGHAFLWTREKGMKDLGTLHGDGASFASCINDRNDVVGTSFGENGPRAYLWRNGVMTDFNTLIPQDSPLYLQFASAINSKGDVIGSGVTSTGETHAFLATQAPTAASAGPKNTTAISRQITLDGTASFSADGAPLTYSWSIPQGSPSAAILHGNTATPEVQFSWRGLYTFQLMVTDSTGASATDIATVNFQGN
ncbi:MAG: PKD domain-containing protein [Bryobacteraceae bacterium]